MKLLKMLNIIFLITTVSLLGQSIEVKKDNVILGEKYIFGYDAKMIQEVGGSFNTIKIALDTFAKKINSEFSLKWFKTSDELITSLDENKITCASIMPLTYLFSDKKNVKPLVGAVAAYSEDIFVRYVVVVRNDSGINKLEDLKDANYARHVSESVSALYLNTELAKLNLKSMNEFFGKKQNYETSEEAFYSVYFKKNTVCLISDDTLNMLIVLNPAIKDQVKVLSKSDKFLVGGLFVTKNITPELEKNLLKTSITLHETSSGKQTLRMVRMKQLQQMTDDDFNSIRKLLKEYKDITNTDYREIYDKTQKATD